MGFRISFGELDGFTDLFFSFFKTVHLIFNSSSITIVRVIQLLVYGAEFFFFWAIITLTITLAFKDTVALSLCSVKVDVD